ncbi:uncharacterized protein LOC108596843 [Drosophila busckii]|uniref:uncharacterized protein LOC108596843 n=1 Tax=Drosophila busckii TaxID=30019 RepID=UPI00083EA30D|nr:uncharacterized protein LOC108596843 [Drosophila busckii]
MTRESWKDSSSDWRDSPFFVVLYEYTVKNAGMPNDMGTLIAYLLLFLVTWYLLLWTARFVLSLVWPVLLVVSALFLFRFLRTFEQEDLVDMLVQAFSLMADTVVAVIAKGLDLVLGVLS